MKNQFHFYIASFLYKAAEGVFCAKGILATLIKSLKNKSETINSLVTLRGENPATLPRKTPSWLLFKDLAKLFIN